VLAMLALLRVAPRLPSPTLRAAAIDPQVGTGKQAHQSNWKAALQLAARCDAFLLRPADASSLRR
jgi:hypothetical protein